LDKAKNPASHAEWVHTSALERVIPEWTIENDKYCQYTRSNLFKTSPYHKLKLNEAIKAHNNPTTDQKLIETSISKNNTEYQQVEKATTKKITPLYFPRAKLKKRPRAIMDSISISPLLSEGSSINEMHAMKLVFLREGIIDGLRARVEKIHGKIKQGIEKLGWDPVMVEAHLHAAAITLVATIDSLRHRTIEVLKAIEKWREELEELVPMLWNNMNYVLKITIDTFFLGKLFNGNSILRALGLANFRNPLLCSMGLEDVHAAPVLLSSHFEGLNVTGEEVATAVALMLREEEFYGRISPIENIDSNSILPMFHVSTDHIGIHRKHKPTNSGVSLLAYHTTLNSSPCLTKLAIQNRSVVDAHFTSLRVHHIEQLKQTPSELTQGILGAVRVILLHPKEPIPPRSELQWSRLSDFLLKDPLKLLHKLASFKASTRITVARARFLEPVFRDSRFDPDIVRHHSESAALLCFWCVVNASKFVLNPELCFDAELQLNQTNLTKIVENLQKELRELREHVADGSLLKNGIQVDNKSKNMQRDRILVLESTQYTLERKKNDCREYILRDKTSAQEIVVSAPQFSINSFRDPETELHRLSLSPSSFWSMATFMDKASAFIKFRQHADGLTATILLSLEKFVISVNDAQILALLSLDSVRDLKRGFSNREFTRQFCEYLVSRISNKEFNGTIQVNHPVRGIEVDGVLSHIQLVVDELGNVKISLIELDGDTKVHQIPEAQHISGGLKLIVPYTFIQLMAFPDIDVFLSRIHLKSGIQNLPCLEFDFTVYEAKNIFISGISADIVFFMEPTAVRCRVVTRSEITVERLFDIHEFLKLMPHVNAHEIFDQFEFESIVDRIALLSWPERTSGYRIEWDSWNEETLQLQVFERGIEIATVQMGPRNSLFDVRRQIHGIPNKFVFENCPSRSAEVGFLAFATYPNIHIRYVDEYDNESEDEENPTDTFFHMNEIGGAKPKEKLKRRRKKKNKKSLMNMMMKRTRRLAEKQAKEDEELRLWKEAEELSLQQQKLTKEVKKDEFMYFETLHKLPGTVTVQFESDFINTSVDLEEIIDRGELLEIEGVRCTVSKDPSSRFDPVTIPLKYPFGNSSKKNPEEDIHDEDESKEEDDETSLEQKELFLQPEEISLEKISLEKELRNVEAFRVERAKAKVTELSKVTVAVDTGSRSVFPSSDIRYKLKLGEFIRINNEHVVQISLNPDDLFEETEFTLTAPYEGSAGIDFCVDKITHIAQSEAEKQKSILQKLKNEELEKKRKAKAEEEGRRTEKFFGYSVKWSTLLPLLGSSTINMKQQDFKSSVTVDFAIKEVYSMLCHQWFPPAEGLDNVKFLKFLKELPSIMDNKIVSPIEVDLIFAKSKQSGERKLNRKDFIKTALPQVAQLKFPWLSADQATTKLLHEHVYVWRDCEVLLWKEAKRMAVVAEAKQQCAAMKLQAIFRGFLSRKLYKDMEKASTMVQSRFKAFRTRVQFVVRLIRFRKETQQRNLELKSLRQAKRGATLVSGVRMFSGTLNIVSVFRHSKGAVAMICYNPENSESFRFIVTLEELKEIVLEATNDCPEDETLYMPRNIELLIQRVKYRTRLGARSLYIGRKLTKDAGIKLAVQGVYIPTSDGTKALHVVTVNEARGDYYFHAYNSFQGCGTKSVILGKVKLNKWMNYDPDVNAQIPEMLKPENQKEMIRWCLKRMVLCKSCALLNHQVMHKRGEDVLMMECEMGEQRMHNTAFTIQSFWRRCQARKVIIGIIHQAYRKQWDPSTRQWYYVRYDTGEVSWRRPYLLGACDLPPPLDSWERTRDANGNLYYFNPFNGRTSWMSEYDAAVLLQKLYRKKQALEFKVDLPRLVKALRFQRDTEEAYKLHPQRLSCVVNYALLLHTRDADHETARTLYTSAIEQASRNPLVLYSFGLFKLAHNQYPRHDTFTDAMRMIEEARRLDPHQQKFMAAFDCFFFWAVVASPSSSCVWLNYALVHMCIFRDFEKADKYFRRAIDLDTKNASAIDNYDDFQENRLPGGKFAGGGPNPQVVKRSVELFHDGEWKQLRDNEAKHEGFALFWFNERTQQSQWQEPNWTLEWIDRRKRAQRTEEIDGWQQYKDTFTGHMFYYNFESGDNQWQVPAFLRNSFKAQ